MCRLESQLIRQARGGSNEALNAVFDSYGERLLALIRLRLGPSLRNKLESRDVMQQTLLKAFEHIDQFEGAGERSLMGWLGAIAHNEIRNQARYFRADGRDARQESTLSLLLPNLGAVLILLLGWGTPPPRLPGFSTPHVSVFWPRCLLRSWS